MIKFDLGGLPYLCGSPLNPLPAPPNERRTSGGLRLSADKHTGILTYFQIKDNRKNIENSNAKKYSHEFTRMNTNSNRRER